MNIRLTELKLEPKGRQAPMTTPPPTVVMRKKTLIDIVPFRTLLVIGPVALPPFGLHLKKIDVDVVF